MRYFLLSVLFLTSLLSYAEEPKPAEPSIWDKAKAAGQNALDAGKEAAAATSEKLAETRELRAKTRWAILGNYSLVDTWIPSKYGVSAVYSPSADGDWELEYLRGSLSFELFVKDLGKMTDEKLIFIHRFFADRNSFSLFVGGGYHAFSVHLGDRLTSMITKNLFPNADLVQIKTLGLVAGLGNRWQFNGGWTLGVDWFSIYIPVATLEAEAPYVSSNATETGKKDVRDVMDVIKHVPTFSILKVQAGISF